ncbi:MAG TPA: hypothetical protein VIK55_12505 [Paludibacter sp.]
MLKKITELDKNQKRMLLKAIATGEINRKTLTPETLIGTEKSDAFLSLMVQSGNKGINVICVGLAKNALEDAGLVQFEKNGQRYLDPECTRPIDSIDELARETVIILPYNDRQ